MSGESQRAFELVQRYQDLAVVDKGSGDVVHDGLCDGAFSDFFNPNTGGHVWVSHTLHRVGDQVLHVTAGCDSVGVYRSLHATSAEEASRALYDLCGEDRHLLLAEGDYVFPENWSERPAAMAAILARFQKLKGLPDLAPEQLLRSSAENAQVRRWLVSFLEQHEALIGAEAPSGISGASATKLNRYEAAHAARLCDGYYIPRPEEAVASNGMISEAAFERARAEAVKNVQATVANLGALTFGQFTALRASDLSISRHGEIPPALSDKLADALRKTRDSLVGWMEVQDDSEARDYDEEALSAAEQALADYDAAFPSAPRFATVAAGTVAEDELEGPRP